MRRNVTEKLQFYLGKMSQLIFDGHLGLSFVEKQIFNSSEV